MILTIRTSKELHTWLKAQTRKSGCSLNEEVVFRLLRDRERDEAKPLLDELRRLLEETRK
jgi:hypothetical protein